MLKNDKISDRNALSPVILQGPYCIVEEFLILVLRQLLAVQITSSSSANFRPFVNSFSLENK